jgi:lysophospholipase L1-like esterase
MRILPNPLTKAKTNAGIFGYTPSRRMSVADAILRGGGALFILVWVCFIYGYVWREVKPFSSATNIVLYIVCPALVASVLFASLRLRPAYRINLVIFLSSVGISVYTVELLLPLSGTSVAWFHSKSMVKKKIAQKFGVDFDTRSRLQVIRDLRRNGVDAVPAIAPLALLQGQRGVYLKSVISINGTEIIPLGGVSKRVTVLCNEIGEYAIFDSDEHGFANPKAIWDSSRIDIAAVGDSFTQGYCVPQNENFVAAIRKRYPATLNLGAGGNGPLLMLATLEEYAARLKPRIVLWFYFEGNDLTDLNKEADSPLLMRYLTGSFQQGLFTKQSAIDRALADYIATAERKAAEKEKKRLEKKKSESAIEGLNWLEATIKLRHLRNTLKSVYESSNRVVPRPITNAEIHLFDEVLIRAKDLVNGWGGNIYFVYLPGWTRYGNIELAEKRYSNLKRGEKYRDTVLQIVKNLGFPIVDIYSTFRAQLDPLALFPFREPGHYNVEGNRVVAKAVLESIEQIKGGL